MDLFSNVKSIDEVLNGYEKRLKIVEVTEDKYDVTLFIKSEVTDIVYRAVAYKNIGDGFDKENFRKAQQFKYVVYNEYKYLSVNTKCSINNMITQIAKDEINRLNLPLDKYIVIGNNKSCSVKIEKVPGFSEEVLNFARCNLIKNNSGYKILLETYNEKKLKVKPRLKESIISLKSH